MALKIGLIKEGKTPPDKRVPLTPKQCARLVQEYSNIDLVVQKSPIRAFKDEEYTQHGIEVVDSVENCDVIMGVKEVNISDLIPNKQFFFFSHTLKKQPYNRELLKAIIDKKIKLTDYEALTKPNGLRLVGFGRYAGIVGCYNGFRAFGLKHSLFSLKPAHECEDRKEMEGELSKVALPKNTKIVLTGFGRVGNGAREIMDLLPIKEVVPEEYLNESFDSPVYTHLNVEDYNKRSDNQDFDKAAFYNSGEGHISTFPDYLPETDMYVACHFWKEGSPFIFTRKDLKSDDIRLSVVADISCDIDGPVASTLRPSTIADPVYGYDPRNEKEVDYKNSDAIAVMAVDNLPCELPKDASEDFGGELLKHVFPALLDSDPTNIIARASETTLDGELSEHFAYLEDYLAGKE